MSRHGSPAEPDHAEQALAKGIHHDRCHQRNFGCTGDRNGSDESPLTSPVDLECRGNDTQSLRGFLPTDDQFLHQGGQYTGLRLVASGFDLPGPFGTEGAHCLGCTGRKQCGKRRDVRDSLQPPDGSGSAQGYLRRRKPPDPRPGDCRGNRLEPGCSPGPSAG